jgi:hypothetical protein
VENIGISENFHSGMIFSSQRRMLCIFYLIPPIIKTVENIGISENFQSRVMFFWPEAHGM